MRSLRALTLCLLLSLPTAFGSAAANADVFSAIELASTSAIPGGPHEQADEALFPVISADGRYVAFVGSFAGVRGIWRRDLVTGAVEQVAPGDATLPSISADGRFVSFTTTERLVPEDANSSPDVYVRDMAPAEGEPAFILVSAVDGSDEAAEYSFGGVGEEGEYGSIASARSAISADGQQVVFETTAESNLLGGGERTPPLEVLVRDIPAERTMLVSAEYNASAERPANGEDLPVQPRVEGSARPYGAAFPGGANTPSFREFQPKPGVPDDGQNAWVGASISADGSTVAWMGQDLGEQTELLPGEQAVEAPSTAEPLWRRIAEGPAAPIRRITGGSDPLAPLCPAAVEGESVPSLLDPCAGPFEHYRELAEGLWGTKVRADFVPQLSANGALVAFLTGARELASGEVQFAGAEDTDDLYVVDMAAGLTRVQALRRLTAIGGGGSSQELLEKSAKVLDYTVSADGTQVAFTTLRTQFPLSSPAYVSAPAAAPGMIELFDADLANDTLTRITHGFEGEEHRSEELPIAERPGVDPYSAEQGAYAPSFSADGNTLAFASTANNLVFGDGNDAPDAFVVHRVEPTFAEVPQYISSPPPGPAITPPWRLGVRARSLADGAVLLDVEVPATGSLAASASSAVRITTTARGSRLRRARRATVTVARRTVAAARAAVGNGENGLVAVTLTLRPLYRALAGGGGLSGSVRVTFTSPGHPALHALVPVRFRRTITAKASHSHAAGRRRKRGRR